MIIFLTMRRTTKMRNQHVLCILAPSLSPLFFFFFFFLGSFHGVHSAHSMCDTTSRCGHITIRYPFWTVSDAPVHCGYPGLGLNCSAGYDYPILSLPKSTYFVTEINYVNKSLTLVSIYVAHKGCHKPPDIVTWDSFPLVHSSTYVNLVFLFNCSGRPPLSSPLVPIDCLQFGDKRSYVFVKQTQEAPALGCEEAVVAAVNGTEVISMCVVEKFANEMNKGFKSVWDAAEECGGCEDSGGRCAFDRTEHAQCFCNDGSNHSDGSICKGKHGDLWRRAITVGSGAGIGIILILIISFRKKPCIRRIIALVRQRSEYFDGEMKISRLVSSKRYTYKDIKKMTNSFKEKLGQGGFGSVYKGKLQDGQLVAVKLLKKLNGDAKEFFNEVTSISKTSHVNVISLLGFCFEGSKRALIYEFMPNGSLEKFIFNKSNILEVDQQLSWDMLYQISLGIAHGLEYLHRGCSTRILHFDIKPHNILLDGNYCPKISDFGLAKICPREESIVSIPGAQGTIGYIAPELIIRDVGGVSHKSDVYSYGMMVLKMVGMRKIIEDSTSEVYFPHWIHQRLELQEELGLHGITNEEVKKLRKK